MAIISIKTLAVLTLCSTASLGLSGCQSSCTGDPRFDNYWCARGNLNDGTYARQTSELRHVAAERQMEVANLRSRLESRQAELAAARAGNSSSAEVRRLEGEIGMLRQQIASLRRR